MTVDVVLYVFLLLYGIHALSACRREKERSMLQTGREHRAGGMRGEAVAIKGSVPEKRLGSQEGRKIPLRRRSRRQALHHCLEQPQSPSNQSPETTRVLTTLRVTKTVQRQRVMIPPSSKRFMTLRRFRACSITTWQKVRVSLCNEVGMKRGVPLPIATTVTMVVTHTELLRKYEETSASTYAMCVP